MNCRGNTSMAERIKYDKQYMENQSLWLNLKILARTVKVVLSCAGAW
ncbi:MAG: sugar transferase [Planctomycetota bacterium]